MKIGILETGAPPGDLAVRFGRYPQMFRRLLGAGYDYADYDVQAGLPADSQAADAWLITGSPAAAYDDDAWVGALKTFLRQARGRAPMVGICFGHQIMAEAFGGKVEKSERGWGVGLHEYRLRERRPWMDEVRQIRLPASHQDQVIAAPPGAVVLAASAFSPFGMLEYPGGRAISLQLHPEFEPAYAQALVASRRGQRISEPEADRAIRSLEGPDDRARLAGWIRRFFAGA